jgi:hypothetical protein
MTWQTQSEAMSTFMNCSDIYGREFAEFPIVSRLLKILKGLSSRRFRSDRMSDIPWRVVADFQQ